MTEDEFRYGFNSKPAVHTKFDGSPLCPPYVPQYTSTTYHNVYDHVRHHTLITTVAHSSRVMANETAGISRRTAGWKCVYRIAVKHKSA